jgi:hypothetical protein
MMIATETGARVTRLVYDGAVYFPIVQAGNVLGPEQVAQLAETTAPVSRVKRFRGILSYEAVPRGWDTSISLRDAPTKSVPLTYGDSVYTIGCFEQLDVTPAGCTVAGIDGPCLVGVGRLYPNALAEIVWPAIQSGLVRGLCVEVSGDEEGDRFLVKDITRVALGGAENNCFPGALILDTWEGDAT